MRRILSVECRRISDWCRNTVFSLPVFLPGPEVHPLSFGKVNLPVGLICQINRSYQNILSQHYRALDPEDGRVCSSFDLEEIRRQLRELEGTP